MSGSERGQVTYLPGFRSWSAHYNYKSSSGQLFTEVKTDAPQVGPWTTSPELNDTITVTLPVPPHIEKTSNAPLTRTNTDYRVA